MLTTSCGIMDHEEARRKRVGGKVGRPSFMMTPSRFWHSLWALKSVSMRTGRFRVVFEGIFTRRQKGSRRTSNDSATESIPVLPAG